MADENDLVEEDDDLFEEEEEQEESAVEPEAEEKPKPKAKAKPKAEPSPEEDANQIQERQLAELGLNALKNSFIEAAKTEGYVAADFEGIGLKGIDEAAKSQFIAEAKSSHEAKVAALKAQGFVYDPAAAGSAEREQALTAQEAAARQAWGATGPGMPATGGEEFDQQVADEVKGGDVMGVIGSLVGRGGLGDFFVKGRKSP